MACADAPIDVLLPSPTIVRWSAVTVVVVVAVALAYVVVAINDERAAEMDRVQEVQTMTVIESR